MTEFERGFCKGLETAMNAIRDCPATEAFDVPSEKIVASAVSALLIAALEIAKKTIEDLHVQR